MLPAGRAEEPAIPPGTWGHQRCALTGRRWCVSAVCSPGPWSSFTHMTST